MSLADFFLSLFRLIDPDLATTFFHLSGADLGKMLVATVVTALAVLRIHELGHLLAVRSFGIPARIVLGGRRGESRFWFLAPMVVLIDDRVMASMQPSQLRIAAASGPIAHLLTCLVCWHWGMVLPAPAWLCAGVTFCGAAYFFICILMNVVPLRALKNDGWKVLWPKVALAEVRRKVGLID
ncbi:hypothetical protein [Ralstonia pseudosolanacearum]|uniref:hypothetical protein n=1 Tax=Ralstonia pseudosolanacearum TaxID=1310165 RepID=UPI003CF93353